MKEVISFLFLAFLAGCGTALKQDDQVNLRVNSHTVNCVGEMEGTCLLVQEGDKIGSDDWENFFFKDDIIGFNYEPGYIYDLLVLKKDNPNPQADESSYKYELVRIKSRKKE